MLGKVAIVKVDDGQKEMTIRLSLFCCGLMRYLFQSLTWRDLKESFYWYVDWVFSRFLTEWWTTYILHSENTHSSGKYHSTACLQFDLFVFRSADKKRQIFLFGLISLMLWAQFFTLYYSVSKNNNFFVPQTKEDLKFFTAKCERIVHRWLTIKIYLCISWNGTLLGSPNW